MVDLRSSSYRKKASERFSKSPSKGSSVSFKSGVVVEGQGQVAISGKGSDRIEFTESKKEEQKSSSPSVASENLSPTSQSVNPKVAATFQEQVSVSDLLSGKVKKVSNVNISGSVASKVARESEKPMSIREDVNYRTMGKVVKPSDVSVNIYTPSKGGSERAKPTVKFDNRDSNILVSSLYSEQTKKAKAFEKRVDDVEKRREKFFSGEGYSRMQEVGKDVSLYASESPFLPDLKLLGQLTGKKKQLGEFQDLFYKGAVSSGLGLGSQLIIIGENIGAVGEGVVKNPKDAKKELFSTAPKKLEKTSFSFLPGGTPINVEGALTVTSAGTGAVFSVPYMKQNILTRKSLETFYPDKFVKSSGGKGGLSSEVVSDIAQAKQVVAEAQASRGIKIKVGEPDFISLSELRYRTPIFKFKANKGVAVDEPVLARIKIVGDAPEKPLLKLKIGKDTPEKPILTIRTGKDVAEKPLLKLRVGEDVAEKSLLTIRGGKDVVEQPLYTFKLQNKPLIKFKMGEDVPESPLVTIKFQDKFVEWKEPLFNRKVKGEGYTSLKELDRRTPIGKLNVRFQKDAPQKSLLKFSVKDPEYLSMNQLKERAPIFTIKTRIDKPFEPYLKDFKSYNEAMKIGRAAPFAVNQNNNQNDVVFVEDYTVRRTREELVGYEGKFAKTIHATPSDIFQGGSQIITKANPSTAGKRGEQGLLNFYKSAPQAGTGKPQAYLGYVGIFKKGSKTSSSKVISGKPEPKLLMFDDYISPTPNNIVKQGVVEINKYQVTKGSGKTFVPAENLASTSPEGQFITPSDYSSAPEVAQKFGLQAGKGSIIEKSGESKFQYYTQERPKGGVFQKLKNVVGDVTGSDVYKMELVPVRTKSVGSDLVGVKEDGVVLDLNEYGSSYGKVRFVQPSSSRSVSGSFSGLSSPVLNGRGEDSVVLSSSRVRVGSNSSSVVKGSGVSGLSSIGKSNVSSGKGSSGSSVVKSSVGSLGSESRSRRVGSNTSSVGSIVSSPSSNTSVVSEGSVSSPVRSNVVSSSRSPSKYTPFRNTEAFKPSKTKSPIGTPKSEKGGLFSVELRRGGVFKKIGKGLTQSDAIRLGQRAAQSSAGRTFRIKSGKTVVPIKAGKGFYIGKGGSVIENVQSAINTSGELKEITYKGISVQKRKGKKLRSVF